MERLPNRTAVDRAITVLNRALRADRDAMTRLVVTNRVMCNQALADDETIQVTDRGGDGFEVGLLGMVNGILGIDPETGWGPVVAITSQRGKLLRFERSSECRTVD